MNRFLRYIATTAILIVVWRHAHWSVALALTGISINQELQVILSRAMAQALRDRGMTQAELDASIRKSVRKSFA